MREHKTIRLFVDSPLSVGAQLALSKEQSHYLVNVMRREVSDSVLVFNGKDGEFRADIATASKNEVILNATEQTRPQRYSPNIALLYAPVKNAKNEFIVQKATEMGINSIQPVITAHTVKDKTKSDKLALVAIEAAEQCERLDVPQVNPIAKLEEALKAYSSHAIILCDETGKGGAAANVLPQISSTSFAILTGPEGGFSSAELEHLHSLPNVHAIGLGPRILRAETAIITAIALVQNYLGDFQQSPDFRG